MGVTLLREAILLAQKRNYQQIITIATHIASQKISEKLGFKAVGQLEYPHRCAK